jgi:hypothetical protein
MTFLSGQILSAADLNDAIDFHTLSRYDLGADHDVTSATGITLQNTALVCTIEDLSEVRLSARFTSNAGGIRWAWSVTGTVTCTSRDIASPGSSTSATDGSSEIADMRLRQNATITEEQLVAHITTATTYAFTERLVVEGAGTIVFRFAQHTSNAAITRMHSQTFATVRRMVNA